MYPFFVDTEGDTTTRNQMELQRSELRLLKLNYTKIRMVRRMRLGRSLPPFRRQIWNMSRMFLWMLAPSQLTLLPHLTSPNNLHILAPPHQMSSALPISLKFHRI